MAALFLVAAFYSALVVRTAAHAGRPARAFWASVLVLLNAALFLGTV